MLLSQAIDEVPGIERLQKLGKEVWFRADAAFAKPEIYEALERWGGRTRFGFRPIVVGREPSDANTIRGDVAQDRVVAAAGKLIG